MLRDILAGIICGVEHSGTTIAMRLMQEHRALGACAECGFLLQDRPQDFFRCPEIYIRHFKRGWKVSDEELRRITESETFEQTYERVREAYERACPHPRSPHASPVRIVDKTPAYIMRLSRILELTEDVPVIVMIKDPRNLYSSYKRRNHPLEVVIRKFKKAYCTVLPGALRTAPERILVVRFEELVTNPLTVLPAMLAHFGAGDDPVYTPDYFAGNITPGVERSWEKNVTTQEAALLRRHIPDRFFVGDCTGKRRPRRGTRAEPSCRVSALVSTYNSEKFIRGRMRDLVQQTLFKKGEMEIIVVDSASQENERDIISQFQRDYPRTMRYVRTARRETLYQAWNRGIRMAAGQYITSANTDDRLRPDALETMANALDRSPRPALVYGNHFVTNCADMTFVEHVRTGYSVKPDYDPSIMLHGCHMGPFPMWRAAIHRDVGYFDESLQSAGDYEFWCRMACKYDFKHIDDFLGLYYDNPEGIVNRGHAVSLREAQAVKDAYRGRLPAPAANLRIDRYYSGPVRRNGYVNICMVTYNRLEFTRQSIEALIAHTRYPHVITVVDNNSQDGTRDYLVGQHNRGIIKNLVLLDENAGIAKASNLAWHQEPGAGYYLKLDNDIVMQKQGWLARMVEVVDGIPQVGAAAYSFEPYSFPVTVMNGLSVRIKPRGNLGGACMLVPKRTEARLGYWSEAYGLYSEEDADYGARIRCAGLLNAYMEDENAGIHLPGGKAAKIQSVTYEARDGAEEFQHAHYRRFKDDCRRRALGSGLFEQTVTAYETGKKSLYVCSEFARRKAPPRQPSGKAAEGRSAGQRRLNIAVLTDEPAGYACPHIRLRAPLSALERTGDVRLHMLDGLKADTVRRAVAGLGDSDIVIAQRQLAKLVSCEELRALLPNPRTKILYDIDDALTHLPEGYPAYAHFRNLQPRIEAYLRNADLVTVATPALQELYSVYRNDIVVLQNHIDESLWNGKNLREGARNRQSEEAVSILFSGTGSHVHDFPVMREALMNIMDRYGKRVKLYLWGCASAETRALRQVQVLHEFTTDYADYASVLAGLPADFAVIPLADNEFNRAKSHIKWLEYSMCGIPGVYSAVGQYRQSIRDGDTGLLVNNRPGAWYGAIAAMIEDSEKRTAIARRARAAVCSGYPLGKLAEAWRDTFWRPDLCGSAAVPRRAKVSIVIPVFNKLEYTSRCLEAIVHNTSGDDYEVVVVDNGSTDGTKDFLEKLGGDVKIITNEENRGFARANNQGAAAASGEYLLFLNNDTEVRQGWLGALEKVLASDPHVAAVGAKLLYPDGTIQHAGVAVVDDRDRGDPLLAVNRYRGEPADLPAANRRKACRALTGACLMVRKACFNQVGGFDEQYWNGYEDVDLCFKLAQRGWKAVYEPASVVIHHESKSGSERFAAVKKNVARLHEKWLGVITPDDIIGPGTGGGQPGMGKGAVAAKGHSGIEASIVIPVYNQADYTLACLESILLHTGGIRHEVIVVDNASSDHSARRVAALQSPAVRLVRNRTNRGFAAACNQGIQAASGRHVVILNNDTLVTSGWLERMLRAMTSQSAVGMVGPVSNYVSHPRQFDGPARYGSLAEMEAYARRLQATHDGCAEETQRLVFFCVVLNRAMLDDVGLLDESFGIGNFEDDDLCWRAKRKKWAMLIARDVFIHHFGSRTFDAHGAALNHTGQMAQNGRLFFEKWNIEPSWYRDHIKRPPRHLLRETQLDQFKRPAVLPATQKHGGDAAALFLRGIGCLNRGEIEGAVDIFDSILATCDPLDYKAAMALRQIEQHAGRQWLRRRERQFLDMLAQRPAMETCLSSVRFHNSPAVMEAVCRVLADPAEAPVGTLPPGADSGMVSIITAVRNGAEALRRTAQSVLRQLYKNWEWIIIDDGSSDGTWDIVRECRQARPGAVIAERFGTNRGVSHARNEGFRLSSGRYVTFLDCGDELLPTYCSDLTRALGAAPETAWSYPVTLQRGEVNRLWSFTAFDVADNLTRNVQPVTSLIRRELFEAVGGFSPDFRQGYEDWDFWVTAVRKGFRGALCRRILFVYNKEPHSRNSLLQADPGKELKAKVLMISRNRQCYKRIGEPEMRLLKSSLRIPPALVNSDFVTQRAGKGTIQPTSVSKAGGGTKILFYFFKNVHIPVLIPIYRKLKHMCPGISVAFGYLPHAPRIRAGFAPEELQLLKAFGEKMYTVPQEFRPDITFIADSVYPWTQGCGRLVHVGHGVLSKGQYYTDTAIARREEQADLVCVPGEFHERVMRRIISSPVAATGMAKLDDLFSGVLTAETAKHALGLPQGGYRYVLYAPTFNEELSCMPIVGDRINEILPDDRTLLVIKLHGSAKREYREMYCKLVQKDRRVIFADELDITPFLALADVMVSDVSSAMMEFAALDKPLVLFNNPGWERYANYNPSDIEFRWRDIGIQVQDLEAMKAAVVKSLADPGEFAEKREQYTRQLFANKYDGRAAERIIDRALALLGEGALQGVA